MSPSPAPASVAAITSRCLAAALVAALGAAALAQAPQPPPTTQKPPATASQPPRGQTGQPQPPAAQQQPPTFRAEANLVRVDVYPTAGGKPVPDLKLDDFEVLEDNVPQEVRTFEHVVVQAPTSEELAARREPNTVAQSRQMAAESKARLFVLYLDTYHISRGGAMSVRDALVRFLRKALGPDDLIAVTTPELPASTVTFARQTGSIEDLVDKFYRWSRRDALTEYDPIEEQYMQCYPPSSADHSTVSPIAREMIARRRERITLESLSELVFHLGGIREERKAVLAVSEGWVLYQQSRGLTQTTAGQMNIGSQFQSRCDSDRQQLSMEDHQRDFRNLVDDANRANVSFYPLDPRGLVVFDQSLATGFIDANVDSINLNSRLESLQNLASATDGIAIVNSNDIDRGLRRVVDDLTSYYLLGYYPTNTKYDGRFRSIKVRVKRPGIDLRYRRGYRAATKEEVASRAAAEPAPGAAPSPTASALSTLSKFRTDAVVQAQGGYTWLAAPDGAVRPTLWLFGEWDPALATRDEQWKPGADVTIVVTAPDRTAAGHGPADADPRRAVVRRAGAGAGRPDGGGLQRAHHDQARGGGARHDRDAAHRRAQVACRRHDRGRPAGAVQARAVHRARVVGGGGPQVQAPGTDQGGGERDRGDDGQQHPAARPDRPSAPDTRHRRRARRDRAPGSSRAKPRSRRSARATTCSRSPSGRATRRRRCSPPSASFRRDEGRGRGLWAQGFGLPAVSGSRPEARHRQESRAQSLKPYMTAVGGAGSSAAPAFRSGTAIRYHTRNASTGMAIQGA